MAIRKFRFTHGQYKPSVIDTGYHFMFNSLMLNKDFTLFDNGATPFDVPEPTLTTNYLGDQYGHLIKGGSCPKFPGNNSTVLYYNGNDTTIFTPGYKPYFDSKIGPTAGKRWLWVRGGYLGSVGADGVITWPKTSSTNFGTNAQANVIFDENETYFYAISSLSRAATTVLNTSIFAIHKTTYAETVLSPAAAPTGYLYTKAKYVGKSSDGIHVFVSCPFFSSATNPNYSDMMVSTLDTSSNTFTSGTTRPMHEQNTVSVGASVTSMTPDLQSSTNNKVYYASVGVASGTTTQIYRQRIPTFLAGSLTYNLAATAGADTNTTLCTLTGLPGGVTLINPSTNPTSTGNDAYIRLHNLQDGSNEYVIAIIQSNINEDNTAFATSTCPPANQRIYVFKVDPTNSANLIYQSHIAGYSVPVYYWAVIPSADMKTILMGGNAGFFVLSWNSGTATYSQGPFIPVSGGARRYSLDELGFVWAEDKAGQLDILFATSTNNVSLRFESGNTNFTYNNSPINTNLLLDSYDFLGARIVSQVQLDAINAVFAANNVATITITTSSTGTTVVPIIINAAGLVNITPTVL